jgi:hypothetical protein
MSELVMNTVGVVSVSVVGTLLAVCFAAVRSKTFRLTIEYDVDGFNEGDRIGLVRKPGKNKSKGYGTGDDDVERGCVGCATAASGQAKGGEEDSTQNDGGGKKVEIKWCVPGDSPMAIVNQTYKTAYKRAKLKVDFTIDPWIISWGIGEPNDKCYGAVMIGPLTGCVYPSGKLLASLFYAVDSDGQDYEEDGAPCVVFYQKKRHAEQAAVACFMASEGGPAEFLQDKVWLKGESADMPAWVVCAVARRVDLVSQGLEMDVMSAAAGKFYDTEDDELW